MATSLQSSGMDVDASSTRSQESKQSSASLHPRRQPAHRSVSLVHGSRKDVSRSESRARSHSPGIGPTHMPQDPIKRPSSSPSSLKPLTGRDSSGESSNAEKWFEKSNNNASRNSTSFVDNSPPFFLQNSSSEETPPDAQNLHHSKFLDLQSAGYLPLRTSMLQMAADNSSTEDFRSVIDDLTIENKKLKRKLRGYQKLQDSHLKDQKLFEVRVHGLPTAKKRELEEMLKRFALGLNGSLQVEPSPDRYGAISTGVPPVISNDKSGSSSTLINDSAYASASTSGQGGSSAPGSDNKRKSAAAAAKTRQHHAIQSYLHDIPAGLHLKHSSVMTEKQKRKLVVRRLEQIFAGKGAVIGSQQAGQQQEVSQLAATIDRHQYFEQQGQHAPKEGQREARIMQESAAQNGTEAADVTSNNSKREKTKASPKAAARPLDQRPTRPLDLDPFRAQDPAENMQYIRHLGFSPLGADVMEPPMDGHGWIYLNLLSNMAQLHTINVTPDFIRKSVQDYSKKLEISNDGRKVRWKGGRSVTRTSSAGDDSPSVGASGSGGLSSDRGSPRKRLKTSEHETSESGSKPSINISENKLAYTPLFYHRSSNDDSDTTSSDDEDEDTNESNLPLLQAGNSSGMTSSGIKTTSSKRNKMREHGPIIFYNNAKFCTDLSGDVKTEEAMMYNAYLYHNAVQHAVGIPVPMSRPTSRDELRGPLATTSELPEPMDLDDNPIPRQDELNFPNQSPLSSQSGADRKAYQFEVSGLGGVCPADNFAINVRSMHARVDDKMAPSTKNEPVPRKYPSRIASILEDDGLLPSRKARAAFHKKVVETDREVLPPSRLPDASCFMAAGDTSPEDDEMSDQGDAMSETPDSPHAPPPSAAPQRIDMAYISSSEESEEGDDGDDEEDESDSEVDLLATARQLDPESIRAQEREYDANMADRLAEEIPAGSSAATAGGGSGFASPASNMDREEWEIAKRAFKAARQREKSAQREALKRRRSGQESDNGE